jgi:hypothetical protein
MSRFTGLLPDNTIPSFIDELAAEIFVVLVQKNDLVTDKKLDDMICNAISMAERMQGALVARWENIKAERKG